MSFYYEKLLFQITTFIYSSCTAALWAGTLFGAETTKKKRKIEDRCEEVLSKRKNCGKREFGDGWVGDG